MDLCRASPPLYCGIFVARCRKCCPWLFFTCFIWLSVTSADCLSQWPRIFHQLSLVTCIMHHTRTIGVINWKIEREDILLNATWKIGIKENIWAKIPPIVYLLSVWLLDILFKILWIYFKWQRNSLANNPCVVCF